MPPRSLFPLELIDPARTVADIESIRRANPQRFEMEQLSRICYADVEAGQVAGVLEVGEEPFWARGHIPGRPIMPGVIMLEAAAQLCSWFVRQVYDPQEYGERFFGFGGIDGVKYRGVVFPGQSLLLLGRRDEIRTRRAVFATQGYVDGRQVFEAKITGMWV
jgi:3-hydroxyacyl-[acyl-carrier-protein] dehydratase